MPIHCRTGARPAATFAQEWARLVDELARRGVLTAPGAADAVGGFGASPPAASPLPAADPATAGCAHRTAGRPSAG